MKFSIVLFSAEAESVESADVSRIWPLVRVTVIAELAEAMAIYSPADAVEPRATFSFAVLDLLVRG